MRRLGLMGDGRVFLIILTFVIAFFPPAIITLTKGKLGYTENAALEE